jgi:pyruvate formate lyase activating enzyme
MTINRENCSGCGKCADACLNDANDLLGKESSAQEVLGEALKDKMFYESSGGGLTVSGGEPSYQPDFTLELLTLAKKEGISLAIETCGIGSRDFYEKCLKLGVTFLYDIKCLDPLRHKALTGSDNSHIMENLSLLMDNGADIIIRLPLIPGCNDSDEDIIALASFLKENEGRYRYAEIMPYHALGTGKAEKIGITPAYVNSNATDEEICRWKELFASCGIDIKISH